MARERRLVGQQLVGRREPAREEEPEGDIRKDRNGDEDRGDLRPAARPYTADGGTDIAGLTAEGEAGRGGIFGGHRAQVSSRSCRPGEGPGFPRIRISSQPWLATISCAKWASMARFMPVAICFRSEEHTSELQSLMRLS